VLAAGRRSIGERVVVFAAPGRGGAAFVAGWKVGGAVERNRAKRVMRAGWSQLKHAAVEDLDVVVVARAGIRGVGSAEVARELADLLRAAVGR